VSSHAGREHLDYQLRHPTNTGRGKIPLERSTARPSSQRKETISNPKRQRYKKEEELDVPLLQKKKGHIKNPSAESSKRTIHIRNAPDRRKEITKNILFDRVKKKLFFQLKRNNFFFLRYTLHPTKKMKKIIMQNGLYNIQTQDIYIRI